MAQITNNERFAEMIKICDSVDEIESIPQTVNIMFQLLRHMVGVLVEQEERLKILEETLKYNSITL